MTPTATQPTPPVIHASNATGNLLYDVLDIPGQPARIVPQSRSLILEYGHRDLEVAPQPETDTFLLTIRTGPALAYDIITWTDAGHLQDALDDAYTDVVDELDRWLNAT